MLYLTTHICITYKLYDVVIDPNSLKVAKHKAMISVIVTPYYFIESRLSKIFLI